MYCEQYKESLRDQVTRMEAKKERVMNESEVAQQWVLQARSVVEIAHRDRDYYHYQYQDMTNQLRSMKSRLGAVERQRDEYEEWYRHEGTKSWLLDIENDKLTRANDVLIHRHEQDVKCKASLAKALTELREKTLAMETKAAATEAKLEKFMSETNNK